MRVGALGALMARFIRSDYPLVEDEDLVGGVEFATEWTTYTSRRGTRKEGRCVPYARITEGDLAGSTIQVIVEERSTSENSRIWLIARFEDVLVATTFQKTGEVQAHVPSHAWFSPDFAMEFRVRTVGVDSCTGSGKLEVGYKWGMV